MDQKIDYGDITNAEELENAIKKGGKFISFQYCISILFAVALRRYSPFFFIEDEQSFKQHKRKYNLLTILFGWWKVPDGIQHTINSLRVNNRGGIDGTEDVLLNFDPESLETGILKMELTNELYCKPTKWDLKAFDRAFSGEIERDKNIKKLVVGLFINTEDNIAPYLTIGLQVERDFDIYVEILEKSLYKQFTKHTYFEFLNMANEDELYDFLEKQGKVYINRIF